MVIPFTFRQLQYFVEVAQQGNVSKAARKLFVSQPSVSTAISQLESLLNQKLFIRNTGQGVTLTTAGLAIIKEAREILVRSANLATLIDTDAGQLSGTLSIACFTDIAPYVMPRLIADFSNRYPDIELILEEVDLRGVYNRLRAGRAELGISYDLGLEKSIARHKLVELYPYVLLSDDHPLGKNEVIDIREIENEPLIMENLPITQEYFLSLFWADGLKPTIKFHTDSFETQRGLVANGYGIALSCTRPAVDKSYDGTPIACVPLAGKMPPQSIVIAHAEDSEGTLIAKKFIQCASEIFRSV